MIQHVSLSWIINTNNHVKFDIDHYYAKWTKHGKLYNTTVCSQLSGNKFEYYFTTGRKYRYELLSDVDAYEKMHPSGTEDKASGSGRTLPSASSIDVLE